MHDLWVKAKSRLPINDGHICFRDYMGRYRDAYVVTKENKKTNKCERQVVTLPKYGIIIKKWEQGEWLDESVVAKLEDEIKKLDESVHFTNEREW